MADEYDFERREEEWFAAHEGKWTTRRKRRDYVGTAEAAELLGVERPRIGRWIGKGQMPMPIAKLGATPIWDRADIEAMRDEVNARKRTGIPQEDLRAVQA
jgi:predicted DNA-binding transcriptional regulator AlpA